MGIEQNLERVANAMERIADNLDRLTVCADFHLERARMMDASKGVESPKVREVMAKAEVTVEPETPAAVEAAEPEFTYEELKAKLIERGVEIPKGTKMTTLLKLWEKHKDAPVFVKQELPADSWNPGDTPEAPAEVDPFDAPVEPAKPAISDDLTLEEARAIIEKNYDRSEADKASLIAAFAEAGQGISNFGAIPAGKHGAVVRKFLELKGVSL